MNTVDLLVLVVLVLNGVIGAFRGFVWQAFRLGGLVLAFYLGRRFGGELAETSQPWFDWDPAGWRVICYVAVFVGTYGLVWLLGFWFRELLNKARLASADRSLGFLLGVLKGAIFVAIAFQILVIFYDWLPADVQIQLVGDTEGTVPASHTFTLHREWLVDRLNEIVPPEIKKDVIDGASRITETGR